MVKGTLPLMWPALMALLLLSVPACSRKVVTVESSRSMERVTSDSVRSISDRAKEIHTSDTVRITITSAGDTVCREVTRWRDRLVTRSDTVRIVVRDTVRQSETVPVVTTVKENKAPSAATWLAIAVILVATAIIVAAGGKFIVRIYRNLR